MSDKKKPQNQTAKSEEMAADMVNASGQTFTTNNGVPVNDSHNTLKAGDRGPSLIEDFIFREKLAHFDRERIPERVVHARASGAHGVFKLTKDMSAYTSADFLNGEGKETPVFVRLSTVAGFRGSSDTPRDVRGFSVKFYTEQGNFDLVGNNIPVFFIQDAMKFPDLIHAVKPEADNQIPQAASAHDTFWDFVSLSPESTHMIMWAMSDRTLPRSLRMMEGFGVHTFKFINKEGKATFVKFHWKPVLGVHSTAWDETQKIAGKNGDFHREDLWKAIEEGNFPEWDFGVQLVAEEDEHKFDFDLLDPTKIIPEELVPVEIIGRMTLNRNPTNFFAEVEQSAFHPGNIVSGIDFSNDPLLQGRLFSYSDTQMYRLGGANHTQLPINRPLETAQNTMRDGFFQHKIHEGKATYTPNSTGGGCPFLAKAMNGGFVSHGERIDAHKIRARSESFRDHYSQAKLFYDSQSEYEKQHLKDGLTFELSKVTVPEIRERVIQQVSNVSMDLAKYAAEKLGHEAPKEPTPVPNHVHNADQTPEDVASIIKPKPIDKSEALSMANTVKDTFKSRKIAVFISDGFSKTTFDEVKKAIEAGGGKCATVAQKLGMIKADDGSEVENKENSYFNCASVLFDALYVIGGEKHVKFLMNEGNAKEFANDTFKHCKAIGYDADAKAFIDKTNVKADEAVVEGNVKAFLDQVKKHRYWDREKTL